MVRKAMQFPFGPVMEKDMSEATHTPTPWMFKGPVRPLHQDERLDFAISPVDDPRCIAEVFGRTGENRYEPAEANAAYIVKAVNNHHDLTSSLRTLLSLLAKDTRPYPSVLHEQAVAEAWKALAKADGAIP